MPPKGTSFWQNISYDKQNVKISAPILAQLALLPNPQNALLYNAFQSTRHPSKLPPHVSTTKMASQSVQPSLHSSWQAISILYNRCLFSILKLPLRMDGSDRIQYMVPWAHLSPQPKRHLDRFSCLHRSHDHDRPINRPINRPTDRPRYSVCKNTPHLCSTVMRPNNK